MGFAFQAMFILLALLWVSQPSRSAADQEPQMSGLTLKQFGDFANQWKLVTVRFRKDTNEMRWTYANEIAWKTLKENRTSYPDGAVFAKIGIQTLIDESFPSSLVPGGARRFQFMVRDRKKFQSTDGWGYAIFDGQGKVFPGDLKMAANACAACHRVVPERGYVFSQSMDFPHFLKNVDWTKKKSLKFEAVAREGLTTDLAKSFADDSVKKVLQLHAPFDQAVFAGTLDEVTPLLTQQAAKTGEPTFFSSRDGTLWVSVSPVRASLQCQLPKKEFLVRIGGKSATKEQENRRCLEP